MLGRCRRAEARRGPRGRGGRWYRAAALPCAPGCLRARPASGARRGARLLRRSPGIASQRRRLGQEFQKRQQVAVRSARQLRAPRCRAGQLPRAEAVPGALVAAAPPGSGGEAAADFTFLTVCFPQNKPQHSYRKDRIMLQILAACEETTCLFLHLKSFWIPP